MFPKISKNWHKFRDVCNFYPRNWLAYRILRMGHLFKYKQMRHSLQRPNQ